MTSKPPPAHRSTFKTSPVGELNVTQLSVLNTNG